jgi:GNAT superfamily N-acetyltransferase
MMMQFRLAVPADAEALAPLNQQLIRDEGHRNPMNAAQLAERMRGWLAGEYQALLAVEGNQIIGYALFRPEPESIYIRQLFVSASIRRMGVGRKLVDKIWELTPSVNRLRIDVLAGNVAGQRFWRGLGFEDYAITMEAERGERRPAGTQA